MPPAWLQFLAGIYLPLSMASALPMPADSHLAGRRQHIGIMQTVWPLTMLYCGPPGLLPRLWFGRGVPTWQGSAHDDHKGHDDRKTDRPMWQTTFAGATHCGARCARGDCIGVWLAFVIGFKFLGSDPGGKYLLAFVPACLFGIALPFFSLAPMRHLTLTNRLIAASRIDTLSLIAYQAGMFAWMGYRAWLYPGLPPTTRTCRFMMQIAMVLGFATTCPVNWRLIRHGTKENPERH